MSDLGPEQVHLIPKWEALTIFAVLPPVSSFFGPSPILISLIKCDIQNGT